MVCGCGIRPQRTIGTAYLGDEHNCRIHTTLGNIDLHETLGVLLRFFISHWRHFELRYPAPNGIRYDFGRTPAPGCRGSAERWQTVLSVIAWFRRAMTPMITPTMN